MVWEDGGGNPAFYPISAPHAVIPFLPLHLHYKLQYTQPKL